MSLGKPIAPEQYEAWETVILTGQIAEHAVPALLEENPEFAAWYNKRAVARAQSPDSGLGYRR